MKNLLTILLALIWTCFALADKEDLSLETFENRALRGFDGNAMLKGSENKERFLNTNGDDPDPEGKAVS